MTEDIVTPWTAINSSKNGFDYDRLIQKFGVAKIDTDLISRFERVTGKPAHPWLKRGIFFAHRDLELVLNDYEQGKPIFLYTGRGPTSEALHLGHMIPFMFTKWLQDVFNAWLVIQIADDEKYFFKDMDFKHIYDLGFENAKDIIACGFDEKKTFIFSNRDYSTNPNYIKLVNTMHKSISVKDIFSIFGLDNTSNVGQLIWPVYQSAAAFSSAFSDILGNDNVRCLVAYAIDQDPYFRLCRDIAPKLGFFKPSSIMTQFLPALQGNSKMSSSVVTTGLVPTIFMTDSEQDIRKKINKFAFSGGRSNVEEQRMYGANIEVDVSCKYLRYFEEDDDVLESIFSRYAKGELLSGEVKKILADKIVSIVNKHKTIRDSITQDTINKFYSMTKDT